MLISIQRGSKPKFIQIHLFLYESSKEDYEFAKYGGSWLIFNHYLIVRPWRPKFDIDQDDLRNLLVWVRIPCLLMMPFSIGTGLERVEITGPVRWLWTSNSSAK